MTHRNALAMMTLLLAAGCARPRLESVTPYAIRQIGDPGAFGARVTGIAAGGSYVHLALTRPAVVAVYTIEPDGSLRMRHGGVIEAGEHWVAVLPPDFSRMESGTARRPPRTSLGASPADGCTADGARVVPGRIVLGPHGAPTSVSCSTGSQITPDASAGFAKPPRLGTWPQTTSLPVSGGSVLILWQHEPQVVFPAELLRYQEGEEGLLVRGFRDLRWGLIRIIP